MAFIIHLVCICKTLTLNHLSLALIVQLCPTVQTTMARI